MSLLLEVTLLWMTTRQRRMSEDAISTEAGATTLAVALEILQYIFMYVCTNQQL
jgi:hypothetical protein